MEISRKQFEEAAEIVMQYAKQQEINYIKSRHLSNRLKKFYINENEILKNTDISVRCLNALKSGDLENLTIKELAEKYSKNDLCRLFRNFGKKSINELEEIMEKAGVYNWR